ncbi:hypothetical protein [Hydrogenophaga sp.]|uniref:hypothetical protein n=1 Tax=Hydrogenophaga sp. TaxID=1904254 RepID=UPI00272EF9C5|nr:hypothetical protein [Hydrogenophaga sp.]MDP2076293.1 hypothetical protein [Hydrogenophaga sp.]MDP3109794.1 hypothetical protein [Hydrogenophaga sp.]
MRLLHPSLSFKPPTDGLSPELIHHLETAEVGSTDFALPVSARNAKRNIERIHTIAVYQAALHATNLTSAYQLEKLYAQEMAGGKISMRNWADTRPTLWDKWSRGESTIRWQLRRGSNLARRRLAVIERRSATFWTFVNMPFWRYLDPELPPLDVVMSDCSSETLLLGTGNSIDFATTAPRDHKRHMELTQLTAALTESSSRYLALCALWRSMRCCVSTDQIGTYVHLYGIWLSCRDALKRDPILGSVADDLYLHTNRYFSTLEITYH